MLWLAIKYLLTAAIVVAVSELARRSGRLGALLGALPLVAVLALVWLQVERQPPEKIADYAWYTFWYVLPTLPMFLLFPWLLARIGFWPTLLASTLLTMACFAVLAAALRPFGIHLVP